MGWRKVVAASGMVGALLIALAMQLQPTGKSIMAEVDRQKGLFVLPPLPFQYDSLEPSIDTKTVEVHYSRHHKAYVDALNKAVPGSNFEKNTLLELFAQASRLPPIIRNNAGGHWNHAFYWSVLRSVQNNRGPSPRMKKLLEEAFGTFDNFKALFRQAGVTTFGSGWAWLIKDQNGKLAITATRNQDNPLMDVAEIKGTPLLTCDVWEHAYYLKYLNRRDEHIDAFWNIVDWQRIEELYGQSN